MKMYEESGPVRVILILGALIASSAWADNYTDTVDVFRNAVSSEFFGESLLDYDYDMERFGIAMNDFLGRN